jgi:hypothetical protein
MKIIVTGSREWPDKHPEIVVEALRLHARVARLRRLGLVVVHGKCPRGVDKIADLWAVWAMQFDWVDDVLC